MFSTACASSFSGTTGIFMRRYTTHTMSAWKSRIDEVRSSVVCEDMSRSTVLATLSRSQMSIRPSGLPSRDEERADQHHALRLAGSAAGSSRGKAEGQINRDPSYYPHFQPGSQQYRADPAPSSSAPRRRRNRTGTGSPAGEQVVHSDSQSRR
jgi:hypothetical protein